MQTISLLLFEPFNTVFFPDGKRLQYSGDTRIVDTLFPTLELSPGQVFEEAELM